MINPSKYTDLIQKYKNYIENSPLLDLDVDHTTGETQVRFSIQFKPHKIYGETKLRVREKYNSSGHLFFYLYCWEKDRKPKGNISAWENEHNHNLETDPHHHHHVPFNRKPVKENLK